jgi:hypothetical protein
MALNPTPSQEYLHLLSPGKIARLDAASGLSGSVDSQDRRTRQNTRSNRQGGHRGEGDERGEAPGGKTQARSSLTFDRETLELKLNDGGNEGSGSGNGSDRDRDRDKGSGDSVTDDQVQEEDSLNFDVTDSIHPPDAVNTSNSESDAFSPINHSRTGDYSNALSMFSPNNDRS